MNDVIDDLLEQVGAEREAQIARWGQQDHRSAFSETALRDFAKKADHWKQVNAARVADDDLSWDGILLEEVFEALGETEPTLRKVELIQVAAVALAEIEAIDRLLADLDGEALDEDAEVDE